MAIDCAWPADAREEEALESEVSPRKPIERPRNVQGLDRTIHTLGILGLLLSLSLSLSYAMDKSSMRLVAETIAENCEWVGHVCM